MLFRIKLVLIFIFLLLSFMKLMRIPCNKSLAETKAFETECNDTSLRNDDNKITETKQTKTLENVNEDQEIKESDGNLIYICILYKTLIEYLSIAL